MLFTPLPLTVTDVALLELQEMVVESPLAIEVELAEIEAVTLGAAVTVTVTVRVIGPPFPWAVTVKS